MRSHGPPKQLIIPINHRQLLLPKKPPPKHRHTHRPQIRNIIHPQQIKTREIHNPRPIFSRRIPHTLIPGRSGRHLDLEQQHRQHTQRHRDITRKQPILIAESHVAAVEDQCHLDADVAGRVVFYGGACAQEEQAGELDYGDEAEVVLAQTGVHGV